MKEKKYFAFISYKREDEEWAKWFQNELENYHLPTNLNGREQVIEAMPEAFRPPKEFRPIFRDIDELKSGNLPDQIYNALAASLHLVVICSTHLADDDKATWVNKEINDFIEIGKKEGVDNVKHIFPFIVDGNPHDKYGRECFPKALRSLAKEQERIGGNVNEGGDVSEVNRERAFVKVLSGMLPDFVTFDMLWNRYDRDKMERERKEKEERDKLLSIQSKYISEKAMKLIADGDSYLARRLAIEVLPKNTSDPERPLVLEAEVLLRKSLEHQTAILRGHTHSAMVSITDKDKSRIYSIGADGYLCVWDISSGALLHRVSTLDKIDAAGVSICISPDGTTLATATNNEVRFWNTRTYEPIGFSLVHSTYITQVIYSTDGRFVFTALADGYIYIWSTGGKFIGKIKDNDNLDSWTVQWMSCSENRLFAATWESIHMWDFDNEMLTNAGSISLPFGRSHCMKFSSDGKYMATSNGNNVCLFDRASYTTGTMTYRMITEGVLEHKGEVLALDISPDCRCIAVGVGKTLYVWKCEFHINYHLSKWKQTQSMAFNALIDHINYLRDNNILIVSLNNGEVRIIDFTEQQCDVIPIEAECIDFSVDGNLMAVVSNNNYAPIIYDADTYGEIFHSKFDSILNHLLIENQNNYISFQDNNRKLVTLSDCISHWKIEDVALLTSPRTTFGDYKCCSKAMTRNGRRAAFAFKTGVLLLVDAENECGTMELEPEENYSIYKSLAFSYDSKFLASTSRNGAKVWDATTGELLCMLPAPSMYSGESIEFSADGTKIISADKSHNVMIWDWDGKKNVAVGPVQLVGHYEQVLYSSFNSNGKLAVSASQNKIIIWDVMTASIMKEFKHSIDKKFVRFSPNNSRIITSDGNNLYVWKYPPLQLLIDETHARCSTRQLTMEERKQYSIR